MSFNPEWINEGKVRGHRWLVVMFDTFEHEDNPFYPEYFDNTDAMKWKVFKPGSMQKVMEVYNLYKRNTDDYEAGERIRDDLGDDGKPLMDPAFDWDLIEIRTIGGKFKVKKLFDPPCLVISGQGAISVINRGPKSFAACMESQTAFIAPNLEVILTGDLDKKAMAKFLDLKGNEIGGHTLGCFGDPFPEETLRKLKGGAKT